jgi:sodium/pantothenate symporter
MAKNEHVVLRSATVAVISIAVIQTVVFAAAAIVNLSNAASAAFWGITSGFLGNTIPKLLSVMGLVELPVYLDPILIGGVISLVVVLAVSRKTVVTERERGYRLSLLVTPVEELDVAEAKRTLWYASALAVFGIVMTVGMLLFYVAPYQRALSVTGKDFNFDWFSGEALFAYAWAVIFVFLAWLMYRAVYRGYLVGGK